MGVEHAAFTPTVVSEIRSGYAWVLCSAFSGRVGLWYAKKLRVVLRTP